MASAHISASISVVLCTYNGSTYLEQQLDSIAAQTMLPTELIVCDDRSTDATIEILTAFQHRAPFPVTIVRNPTNLGSTANFDQAMERASGDFLALSDQDDVWLPKKLSTLVHVLESDAALGGVFSDAHIIESRQPGGDWPKTNRLWTMHGFNRRKQKAFATKEAAISLLLQADIVTGATLLVRTSLRPLWHPIPQSWVHDGWLAWMLAVNTRLQPVPEPLMLYRLHGEQQLGVGSGSTLAERMRALRQTERARYKRVAGQFEDLLQRLQSTGEDRALEDQLRQKIDLLRHRAGLPSHGISRLVSILRYAPAYWRYARGWRSMRKDMFLA